MLEYIASSVATTALPGVLIFMIYLIRSHIPIPKGPYTWISNFCIFTLFLMIILVLFLGLAYISPIGINDDENHEDDKEWNDHDIKEESVKLLSSFVSKFAMFPLLTCEVIIYVVLNLRLLYIWYCTGMWGTIVNRFLCLQRIWGIIYIIGCPLDFWIRLYGTNTYTFTTMENYCSLWMIFYKFMFYSILTSQFIIAVIRLICVKYSIEYHNR